MDRLLIVGLDEPEYLELKERITCPTAFFELLPRIRIDRGRLLVERPNAFEVFVPVSRVIFHCGLPWAYWLQCVMKS